MGAEAEERAVIYRALSVCCDNKQLTWQWFTSKELCLKCASCGKRVMAVREDEISYPPGAEASARQWARES